MFKNLLYNYNVAISVIISIDKNVVQVYNDKDVNLFSKNLINVFLKAYWCVCQSKKYHLVLKLAIPSLERHLLFVPLADSHPIVCTSKVKLDKPPSFSQPIYWLLNQWQRVSIFDCEVIKVSIIDSKLKWSI